MALVTISAVLGPEAMSFAQAGEAPSAAVTQPPVVASPPVIAPPVSTAAPAARKRVLVLPYLGSESHRGQGGQDFGVGFVAGALLGARIGEKLSLNGELTIDFVNVKNAPAGTQANRSEFDLAVSPLFHFRARALEVVVGPKLGLWFGNFGLTSGGRTIDSETARGLLGAANAGVFVPVAKSVSLGGMLSLVLKTFSRTCATLIGQAETCNPSPSLDAEKVVGLNVGALF